jgi:hypothetical protein
MTYKLLIFSIYFLVSNNLITAAERDGGLPSPLFFSVAGTDTLFYPISPSPSLSYSANSIITTVLELESKKPKAQVPLTSSAAKKERDRQKALEDNFIKYRKEFATAIKKTAQSLSIPLPTLSLSKDMTNRDRANIDDVRRTSNIFSAAIINQNKKILAQAKEIDGLQDNLEHKDAQLDTRRIQINVLEKTIQSESEKTTSQQIKIRELEQHIRTLQYSLTVAQQSSASKRQQVDTKSAKRPAKKTK